MLCGRCCVTEPRSRPALRLDIFIEILPRPSRIRQEEGPGSFGRPQPLSRYAALRRPQKTRLTTREPAYVQRSWYRREWV
jgi:hypothetical protein